MKRYSIKVEDVKTTEFELNANSKEEAKKMVEEIVYKTKILNLHCVEHREHYNFVIKKQKSKKRFMNIFH